MSWVEESSHKAGLEATFRQGLLQPLPNLSAKGILIVIGVIAAYVWGLAGTKASPVELIRGIPNILDFVRRLFPPSFDLEQVTIPLGALMAPGNLAIQFPFPEIGLAIFETIQMALIGTTLAVFLSAPFGLLAARNTSPHRYVYLATRFLLNANRAIPGLIFALIFVAAVGLGPFGGVLALAIGEIGVMGKLYAEAIEAIDPQQTTAVRATGANRFQTFMYGVIPQAAPIVASYSLLLFEGNVRSATILGLVGAGGVGFVLAKYMALFQYPKLLAALILIIITVTVIDRASDWLRRKII